MEATTRQSAQVSPQIAAPFSDHPSLWGAVRQYYAAATSSLAKVPSSYSRVLLKVSSGSYATARGMHIALSRKGNGLVRAMNGMYSLIGGADNDLAIALAATAFASTGYALIGGLAAYEW